jgi:single-strand DNA-binding protein
MINQTFITGNLVHDPQYKDLPSGSKVCNFRIAHSRKSTDKNGNQREETLFIGVQVFGKQATHCHQFLHKGSQVMVQGRLQQRDYQTRDGQNRTEISIMAETVQFMDGRPQQNNRLPDSCRNDFQQPQGAPRPNFVPPMPSSPYSAEDCPPPRPPVADDVYEDDIPF